MGFRYRSSLTKTLRIASLTISNVFVYSPLNSFVCSPTHTLNSTFLLELSVKFIYIKFYLLHCLLSMVTVGDQIDDEKVRLADDVFSKICIMINDISLDVKVCAGNLIVSNLANNSITNFKSTYLKQIQKL